MFMLIWVLYHDLTFFTPSDLFFLKFSVLPSGSISMLPSLLTILCMFWLIILNVLWLPLIGRFDFKAWLTNSKRDIWPLIWRFDFKKWLTKAWHWPVTTCLVCTKKFLSDVVVQFASVTRYRITTYMYTCQQIFNVSPFDPSFIEIIPLLTCWFHDCNANSN